RRGPRPACRRSAPRLLTPRLPFQTAPDQPCRGSPARLPRRHRRQGGGHRMNTGRITELASRGVVAVSGPDAATFLDNLFTTDASKAGDRAASFGALLTPQGKILFDFIVFPEAGRYLI